MSIFSDNLYMLIASCKPSMSIKQTPYCGMPIHALSGIPLRCARVAVDIRFKELAIYPALYVIVCGNAWHPGKWI